MHYHFIYYDSGRRCRQLLFASTERRRQNSPASLPAHSHFPSKRRLRYRKTEVFPVRQGLSVPPHETARLPVCSRLSGPLAEQATEAFSWITKDRAGILCRPCLSLCPLPGSLRNDPPSGCSCKTVTPSQSKDPRGFPGLESTKALTYTSARRSFKVKNPLS